MLDRIKKFLGLVPRPRLEYPVDPEREPSYAYPGLEDALKEGIKRIKILCHSSYECSELRYLVWKKYNSELGGYEPIPQRHERFVVLNRCEDGSYEFNWFNTYMEFLNADCLEYHLMEDTYSLTTKLRSDYLDDFIKLDGSLKKVGSWELK